MNKSRGYIEYYTRRKQKIGTSEGFNIDNWEEIPTEDLWEDGEINSEQLKEKLYQEIIRQGVWKIIREI